MASTATTIIARGYLTIAEVHDGDPACTYVLLPSVESVTKKLDGILSATAVSCSVYKVTGASAYELSGDHALSYTRRPDGATGTLGHASGTGTPVAVLATTEAIEFELSDGTNVLDRVRVPVLSDATDVNNALDSYSYLKDALKKQGTTVQDGLVLSSLVALGYTDDAGVRHTLAGINGLYIPALGGRTIGSWWGGPMVDLFDKNGNRRTDLAPGAYATSLVRLNGSAYWSNGNIGFEADGSAWFGGENGLRIDEHGTLIMGNGVLLDFEDGTQDGIVKTLESMVNFQLGLKRLLQPCDANDEEIDWAEAFKSDGTPNGILAKSLKAKVGLWSTGFISALGKNDSASVGGGGAAYNRLDSWRDYDSTKAGYVLSAALGYDLYQHKADVSALTALTSRVSVLESKNYLDALVLSVVGSGNAVTAVTLSADKKTLTVTKGSTFLTSITKSMVEAVLTGNITSHTHSQYAAASSLANYYTKTETNNGFLHTQDNMKYAGGLNSTTTYAAYRIKTTWPATSGSNGMPTINIRGYAYGVAVPIDIDIVTYRYNGAYQNFGAVSKGGWRPEHIYITAEDGVAVIYLVPDTPLYFCQFHVFVYRGQSMNRNFMAGWTVEALSAKPTVTADMKEIPWKTISGSIDNASKLGGVAASEYLTKGNYAATLDSRYARTQMPNNFVHAGNEITMIPDGFSDLLWLNYRAGANGTGAISSYHMGDGNHGYANVKAKGFIKNGSSDSYILLGGGGHKALSDITSTYVTALGTSGNYLTWTKNGSVNNITVPYATNAGSLGGVAASNYLTKSNYSSILDSRYYTKTEVNAKDYIKVIDCYNTTEWNDIRVTGSTPLSMRAFDVYGTEAGGPTSYGNVLEIVGRIRHWQPQLWFDSGKNGNVRHRNKDYNNDEWGEWHTLLDTNNYSAILDGRYYTESEINAKLTDGSVTKVGTVNVGSNIKPIYLNAGVPTACAYSFGNASGNAALNNGTRNSNLNADMLDGAHADDIRKSVMRFKQFTGTSTDGGYDLNTLAPDGGLIVNYGGLDYWGNAPQNASYGIALHFPSTGYTLGGQLFADINHDSATDVTRTLWWRASGTVNSQKTWGKWHQIAFTDSNVDSASKLATARTIWGRNFDGTENVTGALTSVTSITMSGVLHMGGNTISSASDYISLLKGSMAQRLLTGGLLVSGAYSDRTKIPSYGAYISGQAVVGSLKIGDVTISYDASNGGLHVSGGGLYSDSYISAKGSNSDTGSGGGGGAFGLMRSWPAADPGESTNDALGANLGFYLYKNKADLTALTALTSRVSTLEGKNYLSDLTLSQSGSGNAVTAVTLSADKKTLTVTKGSTFLTQHQSLDYIKSLDTRSVETLPNSYGAQMRVNFKENSVNGLSDGGTYNGEVYFKFYGGTNDHTGGYPHQLGFTAKGNIWHRIGTSATTWGDWHKLLDDTNYSSVLNSVYAPVSHTHTFASLTGKPTTLAGYGITDSMFFIEGGDYAGGRFSNAALAQKAHDKYIEFRQGGWFNFKAGKYIVNGGTSSQFLKADGSLDANSYALASSLTSHTSNSTVHITASERTAWNNKVDKVSGKGLSANDFTDALLSKLNGIEAGANKYVLPTASASVLGGVKIGDNITISNGVISTHAPYVHPTATATTIAAASGKVLSAITVNGLGHVTSVSSKTLAAADIPALSWSKITSGKPTTLAGYGITDAVGLYAEQDIAGWKTFLGGFNVTDKSTTHNFADLPRITMSVQGWCYSKFVHSTDDKMHLLDGAATSFDGIHKTFVAGSFVKYGGTARQLLKADGSVASLDVFQAGDIIASRLSFNNGQNFMEWDAENSAFKVNGNLYATGWLSCLGFSHISATEVAVTSIKVGDAVFTQSGSEIYVTIGSTRYKLTKTTA